MHFFVLLLVAIVHPANLSTVPVVLFLVFHTASPVNVTCGCELIVSSFIGCWSHVSVVPSECLLGNSFLVQALSLLVAHRVVVLPHGEVGPSLVDTILLTLLGAAPLSPSLSVTWRPGVLTGLHFSMSMSLRLWSMYRLDVMTLYPNLVRSTVRARI